MLRFQNKKPYYLSAALILALSAIGGAISYRHHHAAAPIQPDGSGQAAIAASVPGQLPTPVLDNVEVNVQGFNVGVVIHTSHFAWAPDQVGKKNVPGEGHAHLYLDQSKVPLTVVADQYPLRNISKGWHVLKVALAQNDHLMYPDQEKTVQFEVIR